jgi:ABC-type uncharacterized transport system substrate-binding protein
MKSMCLGILCYRACSVVFLFFSCFGLATATPVITYVGGDRLALVEARRDRIAAELIRLGHRERVDFELIASSFENDKSKLPPLVADLLRRRPTLIYAGSWDVANEFKQQTKTIPIVFAARANLESPVFRIVDNLRQPEANLTGFTRYINLIPKKLQLLKKPLLQPSR